MTKKIETPIRTYQNWGANAGSYKDEPVDTAHPLNNEPLVKLADYGIATESYYARTDGDNVPYGCAIAGSLKDVWVRKTVAQMLIKVNQRLEARGVELLVLDGYRPIATQEGLWKFFMAQADRDMPLASPDDKRRWVLDFVSDPTAFDRNNSKTWPTHTSGASLDTTMRHIVTKIPVDMGAHFDDMRPISHSAAFEIKLAMGEITVDHPALRYRRILHGEMAVEGFMNYPLETWHFDWGNQMYVRNRKEAGLPSPPAAWYGYSEPPRLAA